MAEQTGRVKLISGIPLFIAENGLNLIESRLDRMIDNDTPLQKGVDIFFGATDEVLRVVSDDNPENKDQVTKVIFGTINGKLVPFLVDLSQPAIDKIEDVDNKEVVLYLRGVAADFVNIYTDDVEQNTKQLTDYMQMIRTSDKTKEVVLYNLLLNRLAKRWGQDPTRRDYLVFIESVLNELWKLVQGDSEEAFEEIERQILSLQSGESK